MISNSRHTDRNCSCFTGLQHGKSVSFLVIEHWSSLSGNRDYALYQVSRLLTENCTFNRSLLFVDRASCMSPVWYKNTIVHSKTTVWLFIMHWNLKSAFGALNSLVWWPFNSVLFCTSCFNWATNLSLSNIFYLITTQGELTSDKIQPSPKFELISFCIRE